MRCPACAARHALPGISRSNALLRRNGATLCSNSASLAWSFQHPFAAARENKQFKTRFTCFCKKFLVKLLRKKLCIFAQIIGSLLRVAKNFQLFRFLLAYDCNKENYENIKLFTFLGRPRSIKIGAAHKKIPKTFHFSSIRAHFRTISWKMFQLCKNFSTFLSAQNLSFHGLQSRAPQNFLTFSKRFLWPTATSNLGKIQNLIKTQHFQIYMARFFL